jgi:hypothetical protein
METIMAYFKDISYIYVEILLHIILFYILFSIKTVSDENPCGDQR